MFYNFESIICFNYCFKLLVSLTCSSQFRFASRVTPRYLPDFTLTIFTLFIFTLLRNSGTVFYFFFVLKMVKQVLFNQAYPAPQ